MSKSEFDRSSRDDVFRVLDDLLPNPEVRQAFAGLAARAVDAVHRVEPRGWAITVQRQRLCLNLGCVAYLGVGRDEAWVLVLDEGGTPPAELQAKSYKGVKSFPGSRWLGVPTDQFPALVEYAQEGIARMLDQILEKAWRCNYRDSHTPAAVDYIAQHGRRSLPQPVLHGAKGGAAGTFADLIEQFLAEYWPTDECRAAMALHDSSRTEARRNLDRALELEGKGPETQFQEAVLDGLIPHSWNERNLQAGKWVAVAPSGMKDIAGALEGNGTISPDQWPAVTRAIVRFVQESTKTPDRIEHTCADFLRAVPKGFQSGVLSPILAALAPESLVTVNRKSLAVLEKLGGPKLTSRLEDYPETNRAIRALIESNEALFERPEFEDHRVEDVFDHFCHWMQAVRDEDGGEAGTATDLDEDGDDTVPEVWKIAPEEQGSLWGQWTEKGYASVGWARIGDVSGLTLEQFEERRTLCAKTMPEFVTSGCVQVWKFANLPVGTILVANRGTREVLGIGRVTGPYTFVPGDDHAHRLPVDWFDRTVRPVNESGWRRTLIELDHAFLEQLNVAGADASAPWLSARAFALLADLRRAPTKETYDASKAEFKLEVEAPFREMFQRLAARLPQAMKDACETKKHVVGKFLKNDWGQGGAYDFLWGAFYPRGGRRVGAPQLYASADQDIVRFGFSFANEDDAALSAFQESLIRGERELVRALPSEVRGRRVTYGTFSIGVGYVLDETLAGSDALQSLIRSRRLTLARVGLDRDTVLSMPRREIEELILATFEGLFPLFEHSLRRARPVGDEAATEEGDHISPGVSEEEPQIHPAYSLADLARDTSLPATAMQDWLRALDRKGQAIVYGPPGTGKTFLAEKLAKHIVGGSDGLLETVQFHPAYGYEDFIQGIRPRTVSGSVSYDLVDGRFVDFCKRAESRTGPSVLIVDEINRANLPRVFGELMYLLEYRDKEIRLASGTRFRIPPRVRVLGTMNTADRSIALVDHALRRRFAFLKLEPQFDVLRKHHGASEFPIDRWIAILERVNARIDDSNHSIGISYFLRADLDEQLESIWRHEILPYLEEFFFDDDGALTDFQWERIAAEIGR